eukprot:TRINITY_DN936_c0_g2_i3.p1 TRINITY_DN936_c0_g2~~TRINITY_DN936_c0_g2_i3.p1  ORF type:complete len:271 (+),score=14.63 TRINITY_DN936_c0_g2_i3:28-813(+)
MRNMKIKRASPESPNLLTLDSSRASSGELEDILLPPCPKKKCPDHSYELSPEQLELAKQISESNQGSFNPFGVISGQNPSDPYIMFRCKFNHYFKLSLNEAKTTWCSMCSKQETQCTDIANKNGGKFLYVASDKMAFFQCAQGHKFCYRVTHLQIFVFILQEVNEMVPGVQEGANEASGAGSRRKEKTRPRVAAQRAGKQLFFQIQEELFLKAQKMIEPTPSVSHSTPIEIRKESKSKTNEYVEQVISTPDSTLLWQLQDR